MRFLGQNLVPLRNFRIVQLTEENTKGKLPAAGGKFWVSLLENIMTLVVFCQIWNEGGRSPATTFLDFFFDFKFDFFWENSNLKFEFFWNFLRKKSNLKFEFFLKFLKKNYLKIFKKNFQKKSNLKYEFFKVRILKCEFFKIWSAKIRT